MNIKTTYALAINSILIVITTSIIGTLLHESAHFFVAKYLNLQAELHHNYVILSEDSPEPQKTIVAAAGPLFSLIFGSIVLWISIQFLKPSLLKLFTLWLGMGGILGFLGYLLIAPFATEGDTGRVFHYFGVPTYVAIAIAIGSFIYINKLFKKFAKYFIYYKNTEVFNQNENRKQLFLYTIWVSIVVMTLLSLPVTNYVSLLPPIFMPMTYFSTMRGYKELSIVDAPLTVNKVSVVLILLTLLSILIFRYLA